MKRSELIEALLHPDCEDELENSDPEVVVATSVRFDMDVLSVYVSEGKITVDVD